MNHQENKLCWYMGIGFPKSFGSQESVEVKKEDICLEN
jgi:hypothetical protein